MICPQCHTPNPPENKFCRECGCALTPAVVPPAPPTEPVEATDTDMTAELTALEAAPVSAVVTEAPTLTPEALATEMATAPSAVPVLSQTAPPPAVDSVQERAAQLLAESARLEQRGWLADATARAEKAAVLLPDSTAPLAALVRLYQAQGDRDKALVMQGQIVRRNPDLLVERDRYNQMQQEAVRAAVAESHSEKTMPASVQPALTGSTVRQKDKAETFPYIPLAVAGGVAALVFCVGVSLWGKRNSEPQITETTLPAYSAPLNAPLPASPAPSALGAGTDSALNQRPTIPATEMRSDPFLRQRPGSVASPAASANGFTPPRRTTPNASTGNSGARSGPRAGTLPLPNLSQPGQVEGNGPVRFVPPASVTVETPQNNPNNGFGSGARVTARPPTETGGGESAPPANPAPEDPGYIRIQVRPGSNPTAPEPPGTGNSNSGSGGGGTDSASTTSVPVSPLERARSLQDAGRYTEAIAAYQDAIRLTAASGDTYQGLAQSYQRTGDVSSARSNYCVAIRSYKAEISAGQRPLVAVRGLTTCRAALEVLGG